MLILLIEGSEQELLSFPNLSLQVWHEGNNPPISLPRTGVLKNQSPNFKVQLWLITIKIQFSITLSNPLVKQSNYKPLQEGQWAQNVQMSLTVESVSWNWGCAFSWGERWMRGRKQQVFLRSHASSLVFCAVPVWDCAREFSSTFSNSEGVPLLHMCIPTKTIKYCEGGAPPSLSSSREEPPVYWGSFPNVMTRGTILCIPTILVIRRVLCKTWLDSSHCILIAPLCPHQIWCSQEIEEGLHTLTKFPGTPSCRSCIAPQTSFNDMVNISIFHDNC